MGQLCPFLNQSLINTSCEHTITKLSLLYDPCNIKPPVDANSNEELYAVFNNRVGKLIQTTAQPEGSFITPIPLTIDKRRRLIYYANDNKIRRVGLNSKAEFVRNLYCLYLLYSL